MYLEVRELRHEPRPLRRPNQVVNQRVADEANSLAILAAFLATGWADVFLSGSDDPSL
jgi:hypothetical protein